MAVQSVPIQPVPIQPAPIQPIYVSPNYRRAKRILDIAFTLLIFPFLLLVGVVVAVLIRLDSKGPIFYRQKRVGQNGVEFEMLKFRSMYANNDSSLHQEAAKRFISGEHLNDDCDVPFKLKYDPRITRVGGFIRKTSIDELPQFLNVLRGEMTLVGPRPPVPYEAALYSPYDWLRLSGKPGLTGPWQVYGRSRVPFPEMVEMDITYLHNQSIWEDLKLIVLTVPVMIQSRGGG